MQLTFHLRDLAIQELRNDYDSGHFFDLETEKGCNREDACRCDNELLHKLTENK